MTKQEHMKNKPILWSDLLTQDMKENARKHREQCKGRSFNKRKHRELSTTTATLFLVKEEVK